jgi:LacI family transcriptional regulator
MVLEACVEVGLRVPEDVGVVGVDNDPVICDFSTPPLSSVSRNDRRVGRQAAVLLHHLMTDARPPGRPTLVPPESVVSRRSTETVAIEDPVVAAVVERIQQHLSEPFRVESLLDCAHLCRRRLEQRFRRSLGSTPAVFLNSLRVERAKRLLAEPKQASLTQIAAACGFSDLRRFRLVFRRLAKRTPAEFRRAVRELS